MQRGKLVIVKIQVLLFMTWFLESSYSSFFLSLKNFSQKMENNFGKETEKVHMSFYLTTRYLLIYLFYLLL